MFNVALNVPIFDSHNNLHHTRTKECCRWSVTSCPGDVVVDLEPVACHLYSWGEKEMNTASHHNQPVHAFICSTPLRAQYHEILWVKALKHLIILWYWGPTFVEGCEGEVGQEAPQLAVAGCLLHLAVRHGGVKLIVRVKGKLFFFFVMSLHLKEKCEVSKGIYPQEGNILMGMFYFKWKSPENKNGVSDNYRMSLSR